MNNPTQPNQSNQPNQMACKPDRGIHIDLNVTSICNLACTYCSEGSGEDGVTCGLSSLKMSNTRVTPEEVAERILAQPGKKSINFWGGEPLVNWEYCKEVINRTKHDPSVNYFFYSNGILVKEYIDEIEKFSDEITEFGKNKNRFVIQISYDGEYLTDTIRLDRSGKGSAKRVKEAYLLLKERKIATSLKSVISYEGLEHLYESFLDLYELQGHYNPTPDLFVEATPEEMQEYYEKIGEELEKIMKFIYENNLNPDVFSWFRLSRPVCSAGAGLCGVDLTGELYPCHGCFYEGRDEVKTGFFTDIGTPKLQEIREKFAE